MVYAGFIIIGKTRVCRVTNWETSVCRVINLENARVLGC